jgi:hypothetical protein
MQQALPLVSPGLTVLFDAAVRVAAIKLRSSVVSVYECVLCVGRTGTYASLGVFYDVKVKKALCTDNVRPSVTCYHDLTGCRIFIKYSI